MQIYKIRCNYGYSKKTISDKDFQRKYSEDRVAGVKRFLNEEEYALFPNTIIANCELINDVEDFQITEDSTLEELENLKNIPNNLSFLRRNIEKTYSLFIPNREKSVLVIDGQHRLEGLKRSNNSVKQNYELLVAFIIGFDRSVIAQQFYTINYEQKPVNRSLLYHLMGEFSTNLDELSFMHKVIKALNELQISPFYKRIKMLGVTSKELNKDDRKLQSISLAFLLDSLSRSISKKLNSGIYQPIFRFYYLNENYHVEIIKLLMKYFNAIKEKSIGWSDPSNSIISKGMGVGALIKVLYLIFPIIFVGEWKMNPSKIREIEKDDFFKYLEGIENIDFTKNGPFGGVGSGGSVNKIKEKVIEELRYFSDGLSYNEFEENLKKEKGVMDQYKQWLKSNLD
jgi:DGQHR domain-containing protein